MSRSAYYSHNNKFPIPFKRDHDSSLRNSIVGTNPATIPSIPNVRNSEQKQVRRRKTFS